MSERKDCQIGPNRLKTQRMFAAKFHNVLCVGLLLVLSRGAAFASETLPMGDPIAELSAQTMALIAPRGEEDEGSLDDHVLAPGPEFAKMRPQAR